MVQSGLHELVTYLGGCKLKFKNIKTVINGGETHPQQRLLSNRLGSQINELAIKRHNPEVPLKIRSKDNGKKLKGKNKGMRNKPMNFNLCNKNYRRRKKRTGDQ